MSNQEAPQVPGAQNNENLPVINQQPEAPKVERPELKITNNVGAQITRSELILPSDRTILEQKIMGKLEAGGGLCGTRFIDLEEKKRQLLGIVADKKLVSGEKFMDRAEIDGVYVDDPDITAKFNDSNVQKLEERLLNNGLTEFFHTNGELKLDNDLLADQMSRPTDQSFLSTSAQNTKEVNAVLSDRLHSYKKKYYRLDIIVGKVDMFHCKDLFAPEDILALKLREQFKEYETRVSLAMIPHYMQRLNFINKQIAEKTQAVSGVTKDELGFLSKSRNEVADKLETEKREVQIMANQLYQTWSEIQKLRDDKGYASTNVNLKIHRTQKEDGSTEFTFNLTNQNPSTKRKDGTSLPDFEELRRQNASKLAAYCNLLINGVKVASTRKASLSWPSFECEIGELFQIHVFTMPSTVQLELMLVDGCSACCWSESVSIIDVEVPGQHVKALTSATQLIQEHNFSMYDYQDQELLKKVKGQSEEDQEKVQKQIEAKRNDIALGVLKNLDINGQLYVKAEWKGNGPNMPPIKSENLFKRIKAGKNRKQYTEQEEVQMLLKQLYIDVNDPRNEKIIKILKETKNEFLVNLFKEDTKNMFFDTEPFRHKLLKARMKNPEFGGVFIPMLESEIIDGDRSTFYLEQLEALFREEAYMRHLEKRAIAQQKDEGGQEQDVSNDLNVVDLDTLRRRQLIFDKLKDRKQQEGGDGKGSNAQYKSIVTEYELDSTTNPFVAIYRRLMRRDRKLKPVVRKRVVTSYENVKECKIYVHCIKGENVPVRADYLDIYRRFKNKDSIENENKNRSNMMRGDRRPTASVGRNTMASRGSRFDQDDDYEEDNETQLVVKDKEEVYNMPMVETYVEVRVQYRDNFAIVKRTKIDEGKMPKWNEVLTFPLESLNKTNFTKEELQQSTTQIICSLYDRQTYATTTDGKFIQQEENRYLGSFSIPLTSVLSNSEKTEFNFKLNRPLVLPNYRVLEDEIYFMDREALADNKLRQNEQIATYLNLSVSIDPAFELPMENSEAYYPGAEDSNLLIAGNEWVRGISTNPKFEKRFKQKALTVFGENLDGKSVFLCRYLAPQQPPKDLIDLDRNPRDPYAIESAARFVSMIPFVADTAAFKDMPDIYCNAQEFIDMGAGDVEEHAYLLANYFTYIDDRQNAGKFRSYVVYGEAMPEGPSVYVMRQEDKPNASFELWAPLTGECFFFENVEEMDQVCGCAVTRGFHLQVRLNDPICQLSKIYFVVGADNIWANIQQFDIPVLINYDFANKKYWKPFFSNDSARRRFFPAAISTVQSPVTYSPKLQQRQVVVLESRIQKYLVEEFQDQRIKDVRKTTKWAITVQDELRRILVDCEEHMRLARHGGTNSSLRQSRQNEDAEIQIDKVTAAMDNLGGSEKQKRVWGFPLNFTFVSLEQVWREVMGTKIHAINRQDVEFALAVYVDSYPANILSVWVYLAAFVDKTFEQGQL